MDNFRNRILGQTRPIQLVSQIISLHTTHQEWDFQRDIKRMMTTENLSFQEVVLFKKRKEVTTAFSYANIVNKKPMSSTRMPPVNIFSSISYLAILVPSTSMRPVLYSLR